MKFSSSFSFIYLFFYIVTVSAFSLISDIFIHFVLFQYLFLCNSFNVYMPRSIVENSYSFYSIYCCCWLHFNVLRIHICTMCSVCSERYSYIPHFYPSTLQFFFNSLLECFYLHFYFIFFINIFFSGKCMLFSNSLHV